MAFLKVSTWALFRPSTYFIICLQGSGTLSGNKTTFLVTSVEPYTSNTNGSSSTAQHSSTVQLSPPSSQRSTQLQKAARCRLNPEQARSSIIAQQFWRRWAASPTGDRAPCLYDDRAHQHAQANIDTRKNKQQQQQRQRQTAHNSGAVVRHPDHNHPNAQPNHSKLPGVA